jgi:hypothetical protein
MNLSELRRGLTRMIGDYALVGQDTTDPTNIVPDYDTDGAAHEGELNELLNNAVRTVVDKLPALFDQESFLCRLAEGEFRIQVPSLRKLDRAELFQDGESRGELSKTTMRALRQDYPEQWEDTDTGEPAWIAPGQIRTRQPNLLRNLFFDIADLGDAADSIPCYTSNNTTILPDNSGVIFPKEETATLTGFLVDVSSFPESNLTGPFSLSFRVQYTGPRFDTLLRVRYTKAASDGTVALATITEPGDYTFTIDTDGVAAITFLPGTNNADLPAELTLDRIQLQQTGTDSQAVSPHTDHFITMPPADGAYEVRVWGWYYPDPLVNLYDRNEVTDKFHKLVRLLAATEWATDKGHEGLTNHWGSQANRELMERLRDIGAQQLAAIENSDGNLDWID